MRFMRLLRFAAFAGVVAVLPSQLAAQITLTPNPSVVTLANVQGQTFQNINIAVTGASTVGFPTRYEPSILNGSQPWAVLKDSSGNQCGGFTCFAPGPFRVELIPSLMPAGATSGVITIGGQGTTIPQAFIQVNIGSATGATHFPTPTSLSFTQANLTPQQITVTTNTGAVPNYLLGLQYTQVQQSWLTVSPAPNSGFPLSSYAISVTPNTTGLTAGTYNANLTITRPGIGFPDATIPISLTIAGTGRTLTPSLTAINLSSTVPTADITLTASPDLPIPHTITVAPADVATASIVAGGDAGNIRNGTVVRVTASNPSAVASATLSIVPHSATGYNRIDIPVSVNSAAGRYLTASPASVSLSQYATSANVVVTPSVAENVAYTMTVTGILESYRAMGYFNVIGATGTILAGGTTLTFYANTTLIPTGTQGTVTLTPSTAGYQALQIPVYISGTGTGGTGNLSISPSSLTFNNVTAGSGSTVSQTISVSSWDLYTAQSFQVGASSTGNWLSVTPTFGQTPTLLTVTVNPTALAATSTQSGNIVITPYTGYGAGIPINIPVTVNVTNPFTVSFNPASVSLSAPAGGASASSTVQVSLTSGSGNPSFTTSVATADGGNWLNVSSNSSTVPATLTVTASPSGLSAGTTRTGTVNILSGTTTVASFSVSFTVNAAASLQLSPSTLTFSHQTTSTSNPPAQTVQIASSGASIGWAATAESAGGWLQVSPATGNTPGNVSVSVNPSGLRAGSYTGTVRVSSSGASNSPQTISVSLTVTTPAIPQVTSVVNAASGAPTVAVPGLIFTISGSDLGSSTPAEAVVSGGSIATTLGGVRVLFDGIPAPLLYVSDRQINGVMPFELYGRFSTRMQVEARSQLSREVELRVADSAPGIFTSNATGSGQAAVLNQNGSVNAGGNPAARGEIIVIYATGIGQTNPASVTGRVATQIGAPLASPVRVTVGGRDAQVLYAGPAPGLISGAAQFNVVVPEDAPTGSAQIGIQVGSASSQGNVSVVLR